MSFEDFDRAINSLIKLSLYPLIILVVGSAIITLLDQMPPAAALGLLVLLVCLSPVAYAIRARRTGGRQPARRGGAERAPLFPANADQDEEQE